MMQPSTNIFSKIGYLTRAKDWRLSFVPFVMGCVYMWLWWFKLPFTVHTLWLTFLSLITAIGFASMGYFINEFCDKASDAKAGKLNKLIMLSSTWQVAVFCSTLLLAFLPWLFLPSTLFSWLLIATQVLLFLIYSLPFPRIKESMYASVFVDAMYAYVVPLVLSFYTFSLIAKSPGFPLWFGVFVVVVFLIGLRNIVIHQVIDVMKDQRSGMRTLPMHLGADGTALVLKSVLLYEVLFVLLWMICLTSQRPETLLWLLFFIPLSVITFKNFWVKKQTTFSSSGIDISYQYVLPVVMLLFAARQHLAWLWVLPFHLVIMVPFYYFEKIGVWIKAVFSWLQRFLYNDVRHAISTLINYPIYFTFRMLGVDLKKENKTAWQYLQAIFKK